MKAKERPGPATLPAQVTNGAYAEPSPVRAAAFAWEDWFRHANTAQQAEALALAQRQGYVLAHQLPAPNNGAKTHPLPNGHDGLTTLRALLAGKSEALHAPAPRSLAISDTTLPLPQQHAARRLVNTPDLGLLRARPAAAAAVLAEVVTQASRAGQRILLVTHQAAFLDQVLQRLEGREAVLPVRFLAPVETLAQLSPCIRGYTLDAQRRLFESSTLTKATCARTDAEERCRRRQLQEPLWPHLAQLAEKYAELEDRRRALEQRMQNAADEVAAYADEIVKDDQPPPNDLFATQLLAAFHSHQQTRAENEQAAQNLREQQTLARAALERARQALTDLAPLARAKQQGRWWTGIWWRATFVKNLAGRINDLEQERDQAQRHVEAVEDGLRRLGESGQHAEAHWTTERQALIASETERRQADLRGQIAAVANEQGPLLEAWRALVDKLEPDHAPAAIEPGAVTHSRARWADAKQQDEAGCLFARQWASFLEESAPRFVAQLPRYASLLAGTIASLTKNPDFAAFADAPFDLVIVDEAERLLENDLLRLAGKGRRWLLVSQAAAGGNGRLSSFDKLWHTLHADASRLAYRWSREGERWCCHLRQVAASERRFLESERLADFPEIELRILNLPKARPHLAQVVFPASMSLAQAKIFIYRELQEAAVQPQGRTAWLQEDACAWSLHFGPAAASELMAVELEAGIREWALASGATQRVDFAKDQWQFAAVEEWLRRYLRFCDLGRTAEIS